MIIQLKAKTDEKTIKDLRLLLIRKNIDAIRVDRSDGVIFVVTGKFGDLARREITEQKCVRKIFMTDRNYKLASKIFKNKNTKFKIGDNTVIGNKKVVIMAGPCSVESKKQILDVAEGVKKAGCSVLRGGAYKPRTGPYDFQGLGKIGLHFLRSAADKHGLAVITEVMDVRDVELISKYTDIFQVGTRNMQNYPLLKELGRSRIPVLLKRGMWATYKELLLAAEYILLGGNENVILCERGIRTHVQETRFTLDLNAVAYLKHETHLPVFVDPSHGTGKANMVRALSRAAVACGADGLIIEAHTDPRISISDADQAVSLEELTKLVREVKKVALAVDRI